MPSERAFVFACEGESLVGILHSGSADARRAVLIIVGGPQYRVGAHRQFVQLARALSAQGIPVLRFDYRGMGDGEGVQRNFEHVQSDIRSATDALFRECPTVTEVALWGLCDGASAACFYAPSDERVKRLVLLNPWVTTPDGQARAYLAHYYLARLTSRAFWRKLLGGDVKVRNAFADFFAKLGRALRPAKATAIPTSVDNSSADIVTDVSSDNSPIEALPSRMANGLEGFTGKVLFILSGRDLTAQEFVDVSRRSKRWRKLMREPRCAVFDVADADHTFSDPQHSATAVRATLAFLQAD